jgi:hypothetical protein
MKGAEPNIPGVLVLQRESRMEDDGRLAVWRLREIESVSDNGSSPSTWPANPNTLAQGDYGWETGENSFNRLA